MKIISSMILNMDIDWDAKVLSSLNPIISNLREIQINNQEIENVADWLAYEEFPSPQNNKTKKCEVKKCEVYTKFEENFKSIPISGDNEINRIFKKAIAPTDLKPQDDYYSYINYKWLQNVKNAKGQEYIYQLDDFRFVQHKVFNELIHIIDEYTKNDKSVQAKEMLKLKMHHFH